LDEELLKRLDRVKLPDEPEL